MKVAVSILSEKENYKEAINKLNMTDADYLHLDIMDGSFTESISFNIDESKKICSLSNKKLDVHIMSTNLDTIIDEYIILKPNNITFHIENKAIDKYIKKIKDNGIKVGLAINPDTNIDIILPYLDKIDIILVMSVVPGKGGQKFMKEIIPKLEKLRELQKDYSYEIEIDGGINDDTIFLVKDYADIIVSGSYITNSINYQDSINNLRV